MGKNIGILTGGGDCPGLNPAIRGCVVRSLGLGSQCTGILDGWKGIIESKTMPLSLEMVEGLMGKGGTILGSSRTNPYKKEGGPQKCLENLKRLGLDAVVAMGGEDTLGAACKLHKEYGFKVVGVPKTMDNDLSATDYTFGFDTSVTIAVEAAERLADTGKSHHRAMILEVMGRHAGWVALFTGLASGGDAVLLPEKKVDIAELAEKVRRAHSRKGYALIIASEGVELSDEKETKFDIDEFGHKILKKRGVGETLEKLIQSRTGIETRHAVIGHIQRGGPPTLFDRILSTRVGVAAAELVHEGKFGLMVALKGNEIVPVPLEKATAELKVVNKPWLDLLEALT